MSPSLSRQARAWAVAVPTAIAGGLGALLVFRLDPRLGPLELLIAFFVIDAASHAATVWMQNKGNVEVWQPFAALLTAALILLPPAGAVTVLAMSTLAGLLVERARPHAVLFNTGQVALTVSLAAGFYHSVAGGQPFGAVVVSAAVMGAAIDESANQAILAIYFRFVDSQSVREHLVGGFRFVRNRVPAMAAMGVLGAAAGQYAEWAALFALPPMAALQAAIADHLHARRDRERIRELLEASNEAHASVRSEDVRSSVIGAAARMLRCEQASIEANPPAEPGAWGAQLSGELAGQWLVVRHRSRGTDLESEEKELLEALAAISSSALENASLVERIQHQALHDPLTGLPNQVLFEDRVTQLAATSYRSHERFAVAVLNLDHFKRVNDSLGHSTGNDLLRLMADRLLGAVREIDTVARLGSDHFTLLLPGMGDADSIAVLAETLLAAVRRPVALGGHELFMTASLGISFFPDDGTRPEHLLRNADSAMHRAKEMGRDTFQAYATGMNELAHMRLVREGELHNAVVRDELRLLYQPQIDLATGRLVGVEALVRWEHPVLGLIGPQEFIPLAEETGLVVAVDSWVLAAATKQAKRWFDAGLASSRVAVNLSGRHFQVPDRLIETVKSTLADSGLPPGLLELEVTESIAVSEDEDTARVLQDVRDLGVKVAIDDFGMGYSMLGRLQRFPIDRLKIDRSFIMEITSAEEEAPIVAAMIALARSLHIECIAEGVETVEQMGFLQDHGCETAQGFLFSRPVEAAEIERMLEAPSVDFSTRGRD